jgi:hypothetical protein
MRVFLAVLLISSSVTAEAKTLTVADLFFGWPICRVPSSFGPGCDCKDMESPNSDWQSTFAEYALVPSTRTDLEINPDGFSLERFIGKITLTSIIRFHRDGKAIISLP